MEKNKKKDKASSFVDKVKNVKDCGEGLVTLVSTVSLVVAAASNLVETAKPLASELMAKASNKDADAQKTAESTTASTDTKAESGEPSGGPLARLAAIGDNIKAGLDEMQSEKRLMQAVRDARQAVLENATASMQVAEYFKAREKAKGAAFGPISEMPACYVIATYAKLDFDKDLTDFFGLVVGKAENAAEGIRVATSREGDPDIYADIKYGQNVQLYIFYCLAEDLEERYSDLSQVFDCDERYDR